ncbi:MAG TPA: AraC family transcriptional regulator [Gemmatirosa sp.]
MFPGIFEADFGVGARVTPGPLDLVRRVRHRDTSLVVDGRDEVGLVLNLSDAHEVHARVAGRAIRDVPRVGSVTVMPPGCRFQFSILGACRVLVVRLPWPTVVGAAVADGGDGARVELQPRVDLDDPTLARRLYAVAAAPDHDAAAAGAAYLAHHLVQHHAAARPRAGAPVPASRGGIAGPRLRRVLDRIAADLARPLPLAALAAEAGLSPFHFAREFARVTGVPPHEYVVRRRVERAVTLLASPEASVAAVAAASGFAHAGHLARQMRRLTGLTPDRFRRGVLPPSDPVDGWPAAGRRRGAP